MYGKYGGTTFKRLAGRRRYGSSREFPTEARLSKSVIIRRYPRLEPHLRRRHRPARVIETFSARGRRDIAGKTLSNNPEMGRLWVKLASAGVRPTRQRLELAEILFGKGDRHFTAETIHGEARALRYPPSLGTVYNTLNQFVENGLLREIALYDSKIWYDTNTGPHCHYYWEDTEQLSDIPDEHIPTLSVPAPAGATVTAIDVIVRVRSGEPENLPECPVAKFELFLK